MTTTTSLPTHNSVAFLSSTGWSAAPTDLSPPLRGEVRCDVAVVGGGYVGMATALRLAERGADVVLVEAGHCGWAASSRNAGYLSNELAGDLDLLMLLYRRSLPALTRYAENSSRFTEGLIDRLAIDCDYEAVGNYKAAVTVNQLKKLRRDAATLSRLGADVDFVEGAGCGLPEGFLGGIHFTGGGLLNPGSFALGMRDALLASGVRVFEQTHVSGIEARGAGPVLTVPGGRVQAGRVVLATNAHTRDFAVGPTGVVPVWTSLVETEAVDDSRLESIGWTTRAGIVTPHMILENYRRTPRGTLLFGTRRLRAALPGLGAREPDAAVVADLSRGFHARFPALADVSAQRAWGGWISMTSFLPVAGECDKNVYYAVSCNGHGVAQSPYLGTLLADRLAGDSPHEDLKAVWRSRPPRLPAFALSGPLLEAAWVGDRVTDRLAGRPS